MPNPHGSRPKKHKKTKIKKENPEETKKEPVSPPEREVDPSERDLSYFIRDRVELMRQVFSILKDRELVAMAPDSLRCLKVDDLQELCLDEVLGISSKRLRSVMDGFQCPSDTDTSNDEDEDGQNIETISLDSISSAEDDILSRSEHNKRKKHGKPKGKKKAKPSSAGTADAPADKRTASSSAGMTVLELIELQARARAIRAQLDAVVTKAVSDEELEENNGDDASSHSSGDTEQSNTAHEAKRHHEDEDDDVVQIKEEPPEVVEILSSGDEGVDPVSGKKKKKDGSKDKSKKSSGGVQPSASAEHATVSQMTHVAQSVTELTLSDTNHIHVAQHQMSKTVQPSRKIKLKRNNLLVSVLNVAKPDSVTKALSSNDCIIVGVVKDIKKNDTANVETERNNPEIAVIVEGKIDEDGHASVKKAGGTDGAVKKIVRSGVSSKKCKRQRQVKDKKGSDEDDELMLELSYTEKMDILDDFEESDSNSSEHDGSLNQSTENLNDSAKISKKSNENESAIDVEGVSADLGVQSNATGPCDESGSVKEFYDVSGVTGSSTCGNSLVSSVVSADVSGNTEAIESETAVESADTPENVVVINEEVEIGKVNDRSAESEHRMESAKVPEDGSQVIIEEMTTSAVEDCGVTLKVAENDAAVVRDVRENVCLAESGSVVDALEVSKKKPEEHKSRSKKRKKSKKKSSSRSGSVSGSEDGGRKSKRVEKKKRQFSSKHLENLQEQGSIGLDDNEGKEEDSIRNCLVLVTSENNLEVSSVGNVGEGERANEILDDCTNLNNSNMKSVNDECSKRREREELSLSEGECSYSSDGIEITEHKPEVVCISDDELASSADSHRSKGKKRKYRKRKKKKCGSTDEKSSGDERRRGFRRSASKSRSDYEEEDSVDGSDEEIKRRRAAVSFLVDRRTNRPSGLMEKTAEDVVNLEVDKTNECSDVSTNDIRVEMDEENVGLNLPENTDRVLEISDDSSGEEDGGCLSKEPTTEEIEELSRRVDTEISREDIVLEKNVMGDIDVGTQKIVEDAAEAVSWKDRWLESDKVKKVLATSNLCNALRKKNKELKKKLAEGKMEENNVEVGIVNAAGDGEKIDLGNDVRSSVDEGSVGQYKTLPGLTKYVDPVKDVVEKKKNDATKDAKQLMRMYKKLLKLQKKGKTHSGGDDAEKKKKKKKDKKEKKRNKERAEDGDGIQGKIGQVTNETRVEVAGAELTQPDDVR